MLNKRTNILFDQETWDFLVGLAKERKSSVGELVRNAVEEVYENDEDRLKKQREQAHEVVLKLRKGMSHTFATSEILDLIHDGRKYE